MQCEILRHLLAPLQNDSADEFFRSLLIPAFPVALPPTQHLFPRAAHAAPMGFCFPESQTASFPRRRNSTSAVWAPAFAGVT